MGGVGSGRKPHREHVDFTELTRMSAAHLLRRMRRINTNEQVKDKIALEVCGKTIGKVVIDQSTHEHYTLTQMAKELAAERKNGSTGAGPEVGAEADSVQSARGVLEACLKREPVVETDSNHAIGSGQSENDSPKQ